MDSKVQILIKSYLYLVLLLSAIRAQETVQTAISPAHRVRPGSDVTVSCTLDETVGSSITWVRTTGGLQRQIAVSAQWKPPNSKPNDPSLVLHTIEEDFEALGRYSLTDSKEGSKDVYVLHIAGVKPEDSSQISCKLGEYTGTGKVYTETIAVCDEVSSKPCNCMEQRGWADPECFQHLSGEVTTYRNALIGIVICLVITILYGIVVSVMLSRDCMMRVQEKAKKKLEDLKKQSTTGNSNTALTPDTEHLNDSGSDTTGYHSHNGEGGLIQSGGGAGMYDSYQHQQHGTDAADMYSDIQVDVHRPLATNPHTNHGFTNDEGTDLPQYNQLVHEKQPSNQYTDIKPYHTTGARPKISNSNNNTSQQASAFAPYGNDSRYNHLQPPVSAPNKSLHTPTNNTSSYPIPHQQSPPMTSPMYRQPPPAQYATYENGLQSISSQVVASPDNWDGHGPQSTKSDRQAPVGRGVEMQPRGAYTDGKEMRGQGRDDEGGFVGGGGGGRGGRFSQPKRLEFPSPGATENGPYVSQTDSVI